MEIPENARVPARPLKETGSSVIIRQPRQALEFVTITNPDEIKDPIKQRAIRRQARRRDNGSKSLSRKPFKIIIDLPGGDTHAGPEQSKMGLQKEGLYYLPPAEHEHSELNAVAPFDLLRPMSTGRGFFFPPPFSSPMNTLVGQLANFIRQGGDGKFCPLMDFWWSIGQLDSTAFFVALANVSRLINQKHPFEPKESPEAMKLYTKSINCLQTRLQTPEDWLSEGVIITVLEFAYYDFLVQDLARWLVHMGGLASIIRRRGGIDTLYSSEVIPLLNFWIDISGSFIFDNTPFFPAPHHLLTQVANKLPSSPILQKWNAVFPELSDITTFLCHAANLSSYIDERAIIDEIWTDDLFVSRTFNAVVHQLLSLQRHTETMEKGISSPQLVMREAMRRACIILFGLLRDKFSVHPSGISQHKHRVKELLVQHPVDWSAFLELRLWVLLTAGLATEGDETSWYIDEIKGTIVQMKIAGWNDGVEVARGILWMEETFRIRIHRLKDLFELSVVH